MSRVAAGCIQALKTVPCDIIRNNRWPRVAPSWCGFGRRESYPLGSLLVLSAGLVQMENCEDASRPLVLSLNTTPQPLGSLFAVEAGSTVAAAEPSRRDFLPYRLPKSRPDRSRRSGIR